MVDMQKILAEYEAKLTPEEKERLREQQEQEARFDMTRSEMTAVFERLGWERPRPTIASLSKSRRQAGKNTEARTEIVLHRGERTLEVRIEDRTSFKGEPYEAIVFFGGPTGHEAYRLDDEFYSSLRDIPDTDDGREWCLCAGTVGRYDRCTVLVEDMKKYLMEQRPEMFPEAAGLRP